MFGAIYGGQRTAFGSLFSPSTLWVQDIELTSSALLANTFTFWAIFLLFRQGHLAYQAGCELDKKLRMTLNFYLHLLNSGITGICYYIQLIQCGRLSPRLCIYYKTNKQTKNPALPDEYIAWP